VGRVEVTRRSVDEVDAAVDDFNAELPESAPGCEHCPATLRALRDQVTDYEASTPDTPQVLPVVLIDIRHSDPNCPTFVGKSGIRRLGDSGSQVVVRHRFTGGTE
jgi:hypothetical protein